MFLYILISRMAVECVINIRHPLSSYCVGEASDFSFSTVCADKDALVSSKINKHTQPLEEQLSNPLYPLLVIRVGCKRNFFLIWIDHFKS